jgi:uncharacterized protein YjiS (DUF1127 family)
MHGSTAHFLKRGITATRIGSPRAKSSLVRRLVAAENDPAKRRIRAWLTELDDERLSGLGLTSEDIAILRGTRSRLRACYPKNGSTR